MHDGLAKTTREHVLEFRHLAGVRQKARNCRAVPIAAERYGVFATQIKPMLDMHGEVIERYVGATLLVYAVLDEGAVIIEAHDAAGIDDATELIVGKIARGTADGTGIGVAGDKGTFTECSDLVKALVVEVGYIEYHARRLHLGERLATGWC